MLEIGHERNVQNWENQTLKCSFHCDHLRVPPKGDDKEKVQSDENYITKPKSRNTSKERHLRAKEIKRKLKRLFTCDLSKSMRQEPNTVAVSTVDDRGRVQSDEKRKRRHKHKERDLRVAVLRRNLKKLVISSGNTCVRREPTIDAVSAEVSDWATVADNYLRALFLSKSQLNSRPGDCACRQHGEHKHT
jgi:hypothetical protein